MITLVRLRQVVTLAEHGNFRRAAVTLGISQPALTKSIQALEASLGVRLFDRQPRGVTLTEYGRLVVEHTRGMVAAEDDLLRNIGLLAGLETGTVRVALGPYPSVMSGYAAAGRLIASHPKLGITLRVTDWREVTKAVSERTADLGIAELTAAVLDGALGTELVGQHRAHFFCRPGHPILGCNPVRLADLLRFPWATTRFPPRVAAAFPRPPGRAGHLDPFNGDFIPAIEVDVPMQLAGIISGSDALAIGPFSVAEHELAAGMLAVVPTPKVNVRASYGFIVLKDRALSPAVQAYMEAVREEDRVGVEREARLARVYGS